MIFILLVIDIILILCFALPIKYLYEKWGNWVNQKAELLREYEYEKMFGRRSWATRSFEIDSSIELVRKKINSLPEISMEALLYDPHKSKNLSPFITLAGDRTFATGIDIEWIDSNTVIINAQQYSDWPANPEDDINLPAKQRQRLAEKLVFHLKSIGTDHTLISYEMETPIWIYVLNTAIVLLLIAAAWGMLQFQNNDAFIKAAGKNHSIIVANTAILWIPIAWISTRIAGVFQLQSISLIDNVISTFGKMQPKD